MARWSCSSLAGMTRSVLQPTHRLGVLSSCFLRSHPPREHVSPSYSTSLSSSRSPSLAPAAGFTCFRGFAHAAAASRVAESSTRSEEPKAKEGDILALVKKLRARTGGVSIGECRKALEESNMDLEEAAVNLRKRGIARASRRADRVAAEGVIAAVCLPAARQSGAASGETEGQASNSGGTKTVCLLELNSETDFVAKNARFVALARAAATAAVQAAEEARRQETGEALSSEQGKRISRAALIEAAQASLVDPQEFREAGLDGLFQPETRRSIPAVPRPGGESEAGGSSTLGDMMALLSQQFGEKLQISSIEHVSLPLSPSPASVHQAVGWYVHGQVAEGVGRAAATVVLEWREKGDLGDSSPAGREEPGPDTGRRLEILAKLLAMQAVATRPRFLKLSDITPTEMETERQILRASVAQQFPSSPDKVDKVVESRLKAQLREQTFVEQDFLLTSQMATVLADGPRDNVSSEGDSAGGAQKENKCEREVVTVKEALRRVAQALQCGDIDVRDLRLLGIGS
uniref:Elongation factor Ts, mitochondrial n=1 Tax=Toxoplasma gondii COUG TaxID=1074873 RepID=A0A2G8XU97_TOXGO|nr:elongation factor TS protein [Toxoplasma gondii COUG]